MMIYHKKKTHLQFLSRVRFSL